MRKMTTLERKPLVQTQHSLLPAASPWQAMAREVVHSPGEPLDGGVRSEMESRFGHDFSRVRIHQDSRAAQSAHAVDANAYTVGQEIVFNNGQYDPASTEGRRLLAHELAHTVQQDDAPSDAMKISQPGEAQESEAHRAGWAAAIGQRPQVGATSAGVLQRDPLPKKKSGESQKSLPPPPPTVVAVPPADGGTPKETPKSTPAPSPGPTAAPPAPAQQPAPEEPAPVPAGPDKAATGSGKTPSEDAGEKPHAALDQSLVRTSNIGGDPTSDFQLQLTYRNFHVASPLVFGRHLDILHEPGVFVQWSYTPPAGIDPLAMGPLKSRTLGAAVSILNYHLFQLHGKDLLELSLDAVGGIQSGDQSTSLLGQLGPTAQLHMPTLLPQLFGPGAETLLTVNFSGQAAPPLAGGGPHQPIFGAALSAGVKVQF